MMKTPLQNFWNLMLTEKASNFSLLFLRCFIGIMMLTHGIAKIENFGTLSTSFADPIGLGSTLSLVLMILTEVGCSILLIVGLITRLAVLPLIFGMIIAAFFTYPELTMSSVELPLLYLGIYIFILLAGPGKYSVDYLLQQAYITVKNSRKDTITKN